jgi:hypothetical protein
VTERVPWGAVVMRLLLGVVVLAAVLWLLLRGPEQLVVDFVLWAWLVGLVGSVVANAVTALRWQLMSEAMTATKLPYGVYFHHLATTRVLGQFLPSLVVDLIGRSASLRAAGSGESMGRLVVPLVLERVLDLVLPVVLLVWSIAVQQSIVVGTGAWASGAGLLVVFAVLAVPGLGPLATLALRIRARLARTPVADVVPTVPRPLAARIAALSIARWISVMVQYWGAGVGLGAVIAPLVVCAAAPLGQLAALIGITPGALGLQEGGWAGALAVLGVDAATIAVFIIATRAAMVVNFTIIAIASWPWRSAQRDGVPPAK